MSKKTTTKRLRIFAGPNGSGKSTLAKALKNPKDKRIKLGIFVNADEIEKEFKKEGSISLFKYYRFKSTTKELREYIQNHGMYSKMLKEKKNVERFKIVKNRVYYTGSYNSYIYKSSYFYH